MNEPMIPQEIREIYVQECVRRSLLASDKEARAYEPIEAAMRRAEAAGYQRGMSVAAHHMR